MLNQFWLSQIELASKIYALLYFEFPKVCEKPHEKPNKEMREKRELDYICEKF